MGILSCGGDKTQHWVLLTAKLCVKTILSEKLVFDISINTWQQARVKQRGDSFLDDGDFLALHQGGHASSS